MRFAIGVGLAVFTVVLFSHCNYSASPLPLKASLPEKDLPTAIRGEWVLRTVHADGLFKTELTLADFVHKMGLSEKAVYFTHKGSAAPSEPGEYQVKGKQIILKTSLQLRSKHPIDVTIQYLTEEELLLRLTTGADARDYAQLIFARTADEIKPVKLPRSAVKTLPGDFNHALVGHAGTVKDDIYSWTLRVEFDPKDPKNELFKTIGFQSGDIIESCGIQPGQMMGDVEEENAATRLKKKSPLELGQEALVAELEHTNGVAIVASRKLGGLSNGFWHTTAYYLTYED